MKNLMWKMNTKTWLLIIAFTASYTWSDGKDVNNDGKITEEDTQALLEMIHAGSAISTDFDLNGDGVIDLKDALFYGQWVNGLYQNPDYPPLFIESLEDTSAYKNYYQNLKERKPLWTEEILKSNYSDNTSKEDLNYVAAEVEFLDSLDKLETYVMGVEGLGATGNLFPTVGFKQKLLKSGIAITDSSVFPNFYSAFDVIHNTDLPVIFTTDAMLQTIYRSYDNILMELEVNKFNNMLVNILNKSLNYAVAHYSEEEDYARDVRDYLTTALALLQPTRSSLPVTNQVSTNLQNISNEKMFETEIYGIYKYLDFSQFKPRGHYTETPELTNYFKAMMWLGRADLAFEISGDNAAPRNKKAALVLWDCVVNSGAYGDWLDFNRYIEFMVGQSDGLHVKGMGSLVNALGVTDIPGFIENFNDSLFDAVAVQSGAGVQKILSAGVVFDKPVDDLDLPQIFSFMPQRFIIDSYTFSQLVYPLVNYREKPSSLDIAFVLGDNSALADHGELNIATVPGILGSQRQLYDEISTKGWQANMYYSWINFLRNLSGVEENQAVSPVFRTLGWRKKMRNTQLTSWAHLRHNTILYAKQSYTGIITCEFPKAMVEPYPEFFKSVAGYASQAKSFFQAMEPGIAAYFTRVEEINLRLMALAQYAAEGKEGPEGEIEWLKQMVTPDYVNVVCGNAKILDGWFFDLIYDTDAEWREPGTSESFTSIADVHTKPADIQGPAKVVHGATGYINLMAVVVELDTCKAVFVGPVGSFYDVITSDPQAPIRINDEEWEKQLSEDAVKPERPIWMKEVMY